MGPNNEILIQLNEMIEKNESVWKCKRCGKTRKTIQRHAETHIEGMSFSCHFCSKTFANSRCLAAHISGIHTELFSCDLCGKTGMHRIAYRNHKQSKHK